jgi:hypothetical protein
VFGGAELALQRMRLDEGPLPSDVENPDLAVGRRRNEEFTRESVYLRSESELTSWLTLELGGRVRVHSDFATRVLRRSAC